VQVHDEKNLERWGKKEGTTGSHLDGMALSQILLNNLEA